LISIPSDALIFDDNRYFVVIENRENEYSIREVTLQGHHNKITYISSGLSEGEKVVVENQLLIFTGLKEK
jgi:cobalt-zinc-cadmium efflux system membrane fusion protein